MCRGADIERTLLLEELVAIEATIGSVDGLDAKGHEHYATNSWRKRVLPQMQQITNHPTFTEILG